MFGITNQLSFFGKKHYTDDSKGWVKPILSWFRFLWGSFTALLIHVWNFAQHCTIRIKSGRTLIYSTPLPWPFHFYLGGTTAAVLNTGNQQVSSQVWQTFIPITGNRLKDQDSMEMRQYFYLKTKDDRTICLLFKHKKLRETKHRYDGSTAEMCFPPAPN